MHLGDTDIRSGTLPLASNVSLLQMGFFSLSSTLLGQGWGWDTETGHREAGGADSISLPSEASWPPWDFGQTVDRFLQACVNEPEGPTADAPRRETGRWSLPKYREHHGRGIENNVVNSN